MSISSFLGCLLAFAAASSAVLASPASVPRRATPRHPAGVMRRLPSRFVGHWVAGPGKGSAAAQLVISPRLLIWQRDEGVDSVGSDRCQISKGGLEIGFQSRKLFMIDAEQKEHFVDLDVVISCRADSLFLEGSSKPVDMGDGRVFTSNPVHDIYVRTGK